MIVYHPKAKTNAHLRKLIKESGENSRVLANRFGLNPKTVLKWRRRDVLHDKPYGAKTHHSVLSLWEQKIIVKVRKHLKHNLDDLVLILKPYIPSLNRDNCYRVLVKHNLNRLPSQFQDKGRGKFGHYLPGFIHIDLSYLPILKGTHQRQYLQVVIDRVTKIVFLMVVNGKTQKEAIRFLKEVVKFYPYNIHRILTDNGKEYGKDFSRQCQQQGMKHKKTRVKHPWTNGQVEITIKSIKEDTIWKHYYPTYQQLEADLKRWQNEYNLTRRLKSIHHLTPYEKMVEYYQSLSQEKRKRRFRRDPEKVLLITP